jgi:hypothetical protein
MSKNKAIFSFPHPKDEGRSAKDKGKASKRVSLGWL